MSISLFPKESDLQSDAVADLLPTHILNGERGQTRTAKTYKGNGVTARDATNYVLLSHILSCQSSIVMVGVTGLEPATF